MSILVRNLPRDVTENELKTLFSVHGEVASCDIVIDKATGQSKGFGFVEMLNPDDVHNAIDSLNATLLNGQKIRVKWSNQEKRQQPEPQLDRVTQKVPAHDVWGNAKQDGDE